MSVWVPRDMEQSSRSCDKWDMSGCHASQKLWILTTKFLKIRSLFTKVFVRLHLLYHCMLHFVTMTACSSSASLSQTTQPDFQVVQQYGIRGKVSYRLKLKLIIILCCSYYIHSGVSFCLSLLQSHLMVPIVLFLRQLLVAMLITLNANGILIGGWELVRHCNMCQHQVHQWRSKASVAR